MVVSVADGTTPDFQVSYTAGATEDSGDAIVRVGDDVLMVLQGVGTGFTAADIALQSRPAA